MTMIKPTIRRTGDATLAKAPASASGPKVATAGQAATPSTGANGGRPRIMSDAFSAIIIVEL